MRRAAGGRRLPLWRRALSCFLWTVILAGGLAYATSLIVPFWFQAHSQHLLVVTSGSMAPRFDAGDAVVMRAIDDPSVLKEGQIVSFWPVGSSRLVTHRIVELTSKPVLHLDAATGRQVPTIDAATGQPVMQKFIVTQGDANATPDPNATPVSRVRGVVLEVHHGWGWVIDWARSATGRAVMLAPPLVALAALELLAVRDGRRRVRPRRTPTPAEDRSIDAYLLG